jgi:hypothetical protein
MFRYALLVLALSNLLHGQMENAARFAGCYQVTSLSWSPPDERIRSIPQQFELLMARTPGGTNFGIRSLNAGADPNANPWEGSWSWQPKGKDKLGIVWGGGFGDFRGTLKRSDEGELVGKLNEYCDYRCEWKRRTGSLHLKKIACGEK